MIPSDAQDSGSFRVLACCRKVSIHGTGYTRFWLGNSHESLAAFAWDGSYRGPRTLERGTIVRCLLKRRWLNGKPVADLYEIIEDFSGPEQAIDLIPRVLLPRPDDLDRLEAAIASIQSTVLAEFAKRVLMDFAFLEPFVSEPASLRYHHAFPGGLLAHSLECAEWLARLNMGNELLSDLGIVAALFHDAGKTLTFRRGKRTRLGHLVSHDALTLKALHAPMHWLEQTWPDAAYGLTHIWTCLGQSWGSRPLNPLVHLVRMVDRLSAEHDKYTTAFSDQDAWRNRASLNDEDHFWRPMPFEMQARAPFQEGADGQA